MASGLIFALLCLLCTGLNDVVFKAYAARSRSRGTYVFGIGLIWLLLQLVLLQGGDFELTFSKTSVAYGVVAGLLVTAANLLLIESLTRIDASLGSTIYRLNSVGVVLLSLVLLGEPLGIYKTLGVLAGIAAVFLLYRKDHSAGGAASGLGMRTFSFFFTLAVLASLLRALYGVVSKAALTAGACLQTLIFIAAVSWIAGGAAYAILVERRFQISGKVLAYAASSGALVFLIVNFLMGAIDRAQASTAIPISNMGFVLALLIAMALGMERLTWRKVLAVVASVCSVLLLSMVF